MKGMDVAMADGEPYGCFYFKEEVDVFARCKEPSQNVRRKSHIGKSIDSQFVIDQLERSV